MARNVYLMPPLMSQPRHGLPHTLGPAAAVRYSGSGLTSGTQRSVRQIRSPGQSNSDLQLGTAVLRPTNCILFPGKTSQVVENEFLKVKYSPYPILQPFPLHKLS